MKIAFIGLGAMGLPMAQRLLQAKHSVSGYDINERARAAFEQGGGKWAASAKAAVQGAELVWLMVVSGDQARQILLDDGVAEAMAPGTLAVVSCTQPASMAQALDAALGQLQVRMLDAPVSGGIVGAQAGSLTIMVGGASELLERAKPALSAVGGRIFHMGEQCGLGSTMKMVNQLLCGVHIAVAAEAMHVAEASGLNPKLVYDIVSVSAGNSWMWGDRGPRMIQDEPPVTSAVDIFVKDLGIVADEARRLKAGLPLTAAALQMFLAASGQGHGKADDSQVIRAYRGLNRAPKKT